MYVRETKWYQKQQQRRARGRRVCGLLGLFVGLVLVPLCFCALQVWATDMHKEMLATKAALTVSSESVQPVWKEQKETKGVWDVYGMLYLKQVFSMNGERLGEKSEAEIISVQKEAVQANTEEVTKQESENIKWEPVEKEQYLIVLDPGHGGEDEGCSFDAVEEKTINLQLALVLKEKLEAMNFQVYLTRDEDWKLGLEERVRLANELHADAFISIHQNSCEDEGASGIETYYYGMAEGRSARLAKLVEQYAVLYTKARDRGAKAVDNLYVIRESNMPSCLVETGFLSNKQERELLQQEAYLEKLTQGLADAVQLYFYPKEMYLTFDDGPVAGKTDVVLDVLKEKGIKATFFVVGKNVEKNPELAKRIVEEGHTIGIHCYQHDYDVLYKDAESYLEDFEKVRQIVLEVTGVEAKLYRFPGGSINSYNKAVYKEIIEKMSQQGYTYFDWNASFEDAVRGVTCEKILQNAKESTLGRKKVVMLAHDIVGATVECLEEVLEQFPEYKMLPLEETVEPVQF